MHVARLVLPRRQSTCVEVVTSSVSTASSCEHMTSRHDRVHMTSPIANYYTLSPISNEPYSSAEKHDQIITTQFYAGYTPTYAQPFDAHCCRMGAAIRHPLPDRVKPSFVIFDTSPERQSARMSKITNDGLTQSGTGCFIAVPM